MHRILSCVAAAGALLLASDAGAQIQPGAGGTRSDTGVIAEPFETVVRVDRNPNQVVVRDAAGQQRTIFLDDTTALERQGRAGSNGIPIRMRDLMVGDRIVVGGSTGTRGFTAQRIRVLSPGGVGAPPAGTAPPPESTSNPADPDPPGTTRPGADPGIPAPDTATPGQQRPGQSPTGPGFGGTRNPLGPGLGGSGGPSGGSGSGGSGSGGSGGGGGGGGGG
jgi:hypothetical protein